MRRIATLAALAAASLTLAAPVSAAPGPAGFYGVVPQGTQWHSDSDLDLMREGGVAQVRMMLHWGVVEPEPGRFDWTATDEIVRNVTRRGIRPLFFLYASSPWAVAQDGRDCASFDGDCAVLAPASDTTRAGFAELARAAVARYGRDGEFWRAPPPCELPADVPFVCPADEPPCGCEEPLPVETWQVWNEQNSPKYFAPKVNVRRYAKLLEVSAAAIRSEDPQADVLLGGMWGPSSLGRKSARRPVMPVAPYLERLYRLPGTRENFDSIALHPYSGNLEGMRGQLVDARRVAKRAGDRGVGTWVTEVGWASGGPGANPQVQGGRGQARLLRESFKLLTERRRAFRLRGVFWYTWRDGAGGNTICSWCGHAGLRKGSGAAKPAWKSFTHFTGGR